MSTLIPLAILAAIVVIGVVVLRKRLSTGGSGGNGGSRGRPGADKH
ncbi:hypothetical protein [Brevundimonas naejangsanensis]